MGITAETQSILVVRMRDGPRDVDAKKSWNAMTQLGVEVWQKTDQRLAELCDLDPGDVMILRKEKDQGHDEAIEAEFARTGRSARVGLNYNHKAAVLAVVHGEFLTSLASGERVIKEAIEEGRTGLMLYAVWSGSEFDLKAEGRDEDVLRLGYVLKYTAPIIGLGSHGGLRLAMWVYSPQEADRALIRVEANERRRTLGVPKREEAKRKREEAAKKKAAEEKVKEEAEEAAIAEIGLVTAKFSDALDKKTTFANKADCTERSRNLQQSRYPGWNTRYAVAQIADRIGEDLAVFQARYGEQRLREIPEYRSLLWSAARRWDDWFKRFGATDGAYYQSPEFFAWLYAHLQLKRNRRFLNAPTAEAAEKFKVATKPWKSYEGLGFDVADEPAKLELPTAVRKLVARDAKREKRARKVAAAAAAAAAAEKTESNEMTVPKPKTTTAKPTAASV